MDKAIFLVLAICFNAAASPVMETRRITCDSDCSKGKGLPLSNGDTLRCTIRHTENVPRPAKTDKTAPPPQKIRKNWYVYRGKRLAVRIGWEQRETDVTNKYVEGYFIVANNIMYEVKLEMEASKKRTHDYVQKMPSKIRFQFRCFGTRNQVLRAGDNVTIQLDGVPMGLKDNKRITQRESVQIPFCARKMAQIKDSDIVPEECLKTLKARDVRQQKEANATNADQTGRSSNSTVHNLQGATEPSLQEDTSHQSSKAIFPNTKQNVFIVIVAATLVIAVPILYVCATKLKRGKKQDTAAPNILVVADHNNTDKTTTHTMVENLKKHVHANIVSNLSDRGGITRSPAQWYRNHIAKAKIVIFVIHQRNLEEYLTTKDVKSYQIKSDDNDKPLGFELTCAKAEVQNFRQSQNEVITLVEDYAPEDFQGAWFSPCGRGKIFKLAEKYNTDDKFYRHLFRALKTVKKMQSRENRAERDSIETVESVDHERLLTEENGGEEAQKLGVTAKTDWTKSGARPKTQL